MWSSISHLRRGSRWLFGVSKNHSHSLGAKSHYWYSKEYANGLKLFQKMSLQNIVNNDRLTLKIPKAAVFRKIISFGYIFPFESILSYRYLNRWIYKFYYFRNDKKRCKSYCWLVIWCKSYCWLERYQFNVLLWSRESIELLVIIKGK